MKKLLTLVLLLITAGSLGFGYLKASETTRMQDEVEQAMRRAEVAEAEAMKQTIIATEQRKAAEWAVEEARRAMLLAEQSLAECQKRRR